MKLGIATLLTLTGLVALPGCGGGDSNGTSAGEGVTTGWVAEEGIRIENATSSVTIRLADGTYRTWFGGLQTATSSDGSTWSSAQPIQGLNLSQGEFGRNPAVVLRSDGTFVLIYESVLNNVSRLFRAVSSDGVHFSRTSGQGDLGAVMVPQAADKNFLSVPDLFASDDDTYRMYFVAGGDHTETAVTTDGGLTWTREGRIEIADWSAERWIVDPDIVRADSGEYVLFFAAPPEGSSGLMNKRILSATSGDGLNFKLDTVEAISVSTTEEDLVDPDVVRLPDGRFRMYYGRTSGPGSHYDLRSAVADVLPAP